MSQEAETMQGQPQAEAPTFEHSYADLPDHFFARADLNPVAAPKLIRINRPLAGTLGIDPDWLASADGIAMLAGNRMPAGALPIAQAYAGHQFGNFVPQLGDGRAMLIGERIDAEGARKDVQLKGAGPTRFSRNGDGRAALGPVLREYLASEAMAALGIPTTRTLAAVVSGEPVFRETRLPGAVLARVAASHIRIGTFQFYAARGDEDALRTLADYTIARHYPHLALHEQPNLGLLEAVIAAQANLVARWMLVGFIHGVMNTDNMTVSGETIDYGPCAFMDAYHPSTVFSSIDHAGRYAYVNQPRIAVWNLARFAEALLPLIGQGDDVVAVAEAALGRFQATYEAAFYGGLRRKVGFMTDADSDMKLISELLETMAANGADFTLTFRRLAQELDAIPGETSARGLFLDPTGFENWLPRWRQRLAAEPEHDAERARRMRAVNPKYIARNHRVEAAIAAATSEADFRPFEELLAVLANPFDEQPENSAYASPPLDHERVLRTFCGT